MKPDLASRWGVAAFGCWLVALLLAFVPVGARGEVSGEWSSCGRPVAVALRPEDTACGESGRRRVGGLSVWLVLTGAVSTVYVAQCARAGHRVEE